MACVLMCYTIPQILPQWLMKNAATLLVDRIQHAEDNATNQLPIQYACVCKKIKMDADIIYKITKEIMPLIFFFL